jgi:hypothetical protein
MMTWIETRAPSPENPEVASALRDATQGYPPEYAASRSGAARLPDAVKNDSIVMSHSLLPDVMRHIFAAFRAMMDPALPLQRRQHEMIAATVSILNDCYY